MIRGRIFRLAELRRDSPLSSTATAVRATSGPFRPRQAIRCDFHEHSADLQCRDDSLRSESLQQTNISRPALCSQTYLGMAHSAAAAAAAATQVAECHWAITAMSGRGGAAPSPRCGHTLSLTGTDPSSHRLIVAFGETVRAISVQQHPMHRVVMILYSLALSWHVPMTLTHRHAHGAPTARLSVRSVHTALTRKATTPVLHCTVSTVLVNSSVGCYISKNVTSITSCRGSRLPISFRFARMNDALPCPPLCVSIPVQGTRSGLLERRVRHVEHFQRKSRVEPVEC